MSEPNADYVLDEHIRERWGVGDGAWFEYHGLESPESSDAEIWYRSHQEVIVIDGPSYDGKSVDGAEEPWPPFAERQEEGVPWCYQVRFADGLEWTVFEDELFTSREAFFRPEPPAQIDSSGACPACGSGRTREWASDRQCLDCGHLFGVQIDSSGAS